MQNAQDIKTSKAAIPDDQNLLKKLQALKEISVQQKKVIGAFYIPIGHSPLC